MQPAYIARRFGVFLLIVWLAATLNFFLPRLSGQDPVHAKLLQQAALGGYVQAGIAEMTREYERRFGLDRPLLRQYVTYLGDVARLDFNYSIANYPRTVRELVADALPWTIALLGTTTLLSFGIGTLLFQAIRENDHFVIQGVVFIVIVALGLTTFVLDVVYPWLDPRISYR